MRTERLPVIKLKPRHARITGRAMLEVAAATIALCALAIFLMSAGCATYTTTQTDSSNANKTNEVRTITTTVKVKTFFSAKSDLAKSAVVNTDKSQSSRVGSLSQQATNDAANVLRIIVEKDK